MLPRHLVPLLCIALALGACSSSDSSDDTSQDTPPLSDQTDAGGDTGTDPDTGLEDAGGGTTAGTGTDTGSDDNGTTTGTDTGSDSSGGGTTTGTSTGSDGSGTTAGTDTGSDSSGGGTTTGADTGSDGSGTTTGTGTGSDSSGDGTTTGTDTGSDGSDGGGTTGGGLDDGDGMDEQSEPAQPGVPGNIDATRLAFGLQRALRATLLDLNERLSGGVPLTDQQQACLGTFDPALGEPVFALDCEQPLATNSIEVFVERGALHATDACAADLATGSTERCVMESAGLMLRPLFEVPEMGRPRPVFGGAIVGYAIDAPLLTLANEESAPFGLFDCRFELQNGALQQPSFGGVAGCRLQVSSVADRIDFLLPPF